MNNNKFVIFSFVLGLVQRCLFQPSVAMRYDYSMPLDASMWNGSVGELSSCVISNMPFAHVL